MTISQRVFYLLTKQGKKQNELSEFTGISKSTISAWNTRGTNPAADTISTIADFFDVSTDYLLTGKEKSSSLYVLSTDEQELLENFKKLSDKSKGRLLEKAEDLIEIDELEKQISIENKSPVGTVLMAARSFDNHPPELVTGDFSDIINAPDATDEY